MALICLTTPLPSTEAIAPSIFPISSSFSSTSDSSPKSSFFTFTSRPVTRSFLSLVPSLPHHLPATIVFPIRRLPRHIVRMSDLYDGLDTSAEWDWPRAPHRPNIFPTFSPMDIPLPLPMPEDPPRRDEEALAFWEGGVLEEYGYEEKDYNAFWEDDGIEM